MVNNLNEIITFYVYNQNGSSDFTRSYIGSVNKEWNTLLRELAIPKYSVLNISKFTNPQVFSDYIYIFELSFNNPNNLCNCEDRIVNSIIK